MGSWFRWHWYYQVTRRAQRVPARIAHRLPAWLKYWTYIDVVADATTRPPLDRQIVGDIRAFDILKHMKSR